MADTPLQLALREMRRHFADPRVLAGLAVVSILTGLVGPFGTFERLDTLPRLAYWAAIAVSTYAVGTLIGILLLLRLHRTVRSRVLRIFAIGLAQGPPIALVVYAINALSFETSSAFDLPPLLIYCTLIALGVTVLSEIAATFVDGHQSAAAVPPPILDRLPVHQRGELQALVVSDHYVEVITDRGTALILLRLSDAMRETGSVAGVQIHRSHWVALDAVARTVRADGKLFVELKSGRRLPVSRGYLTAARSAGLTA